MTHYEEMLKTAAKAKEIFDARDISARNFISTLIKGFKDYCEMPEDRLLLLPWKKEQRKYEEISDDVFGMFKAASFDEESDGWILGIYIKLFGPKLPTAAKVTFGITVTDKDTKGYSVGIGTLKAQLVDLNDQTQREAFFDTIVKAIKRSFEEQHKDGRSKYGFSVENS